MSGDAIYIDPDDWDLSALPLCTLCGCRYTRGTSHTCRGATPAHDPLCECSARPDSGWTRCDCALIARVRADERMRP